MIQSTLLVFLLASNCRSLTVRDERPIENIRSYIYPQEDDASEQYYKGHRFKTYKYVQSVPVSDHHVEVYQPGASQNYQRLEKKYYTPVPIPHVKKPYVEQYLKEVEPTTKTLFNPKPNPVRYYAQTTESPEEQSAQTIKPSSFRYLYQPAQSGKEYPQRLTSTVQYQTPQDTSKSSIYIAQHVAKKPEEASNEPPIQNIVHSRDYYVQLQQYRSRQPPSLERAVPAKEPQVKPNLYEVNPEQLVLVNHYKSRQYLPDKYSFRRQKQYDPSDYETSAQVEQPKYQAQPVTHYIQYHRPVHVKHIPEQKTSKYQDVEVEEDVEKPQRYEYQYVPRENERYHQDRRVVSYVPVRYTTPEVEDKRDSLQTLNKKGNVDETPDPNHSQYARFIYYKQDV